MEKKYIKYKRKADRLILFFGLLSQENLKFESAIQVHQYLGNTLSLIEELHGVGEQMGVLDFIKFKEATSYRQYYWDALEHLIIIHKNGSYAIYDQMNEVGYSTHIKDLYCYRETGKVRVAMTNTSGKDIWEDFYKIKNGHTVELAEK